jgi:putative lipoprotein
MTQPNRVRLTRNPSLRILPALLASYVLVACAGGTSAHSQRAEPAMQNSAAAVDFGDLSGTTWVAEDIDNQGVLDNLQSRLQIISIAEVAGFAGCNSYHGPAELGSATKLRLGPFATTRMMCAEAVMEQERRFLDALSRAHSAHMQNGLLFLLDDAGVTILRFSAVGS